MSFLRHSLSDSQRRGWRAWLLLLALACTVSLYSIEVTHDHRTAADELRCPTCHVLGHSALDVYTPDLGAVFEPALLSFLLLPVAVAGLPRRHFQLKPQTRAPPVLSLSPT